MLLHRLFYCNVILPVTYINGSFGCVFYVVICMTNMKCENSRFVFLQAVHVYLVFGIVPA